MAKTFINIDQRWFGSCSSRASSAAHTLRFAAATRRWQARALAAAGVLGCFKFH